MPPELLISTKKPANDTSTPVAKIGESSILVALRVEAEEKVDLEINNLKKIISNSDTSIEDKNKAFEKIKELNATRSTEETLEKKIESTYKLKSFITINSNNIDVLVNTSTYDDKLANDIMRTIQESFDTPKNITVKFQK